jgi:hypothetical protein
LRRNHRLRRTAAWWFRRFKLRQRLAVNQVQHFAAVQHFAFQQRFRYAHHGVGAFFDDLAGALLSIFHQLADLLIDADGRGLAIIPVLRNFAAQENLLVLLTEA